MRLILLMCRNGRTDRVAVRRMDSYDPNEHTRTQPFNGLWSGTTRVGRYQKKHSPTQPSPLSDILYQLPPFTTIHNILFVQFTCLAWAKQTTVLSGRPDLLRKRGTWGHSWAWPDFIAVDILNLVCDAATCCQWCGNLLVGFVEGRVICGSVIALATPIATRRSATRRCTCWRAATGLSTSGTVDTARRAPTFPC